MSSPSAPFPAASETSEPRLRLNKYLSERAAVSRREADRLIDAGRVRVNGRVAELGQQVSRQDRVELDGRSVDPERSGLHYLAFNKPVGVVCTTDRREPRNIIDYLGFPERIFPIGRLDADSEGLILLTNDGDIVNLILRARYGHEKAYDVWVNRPIDTDFLERMAGGVPILGTVTKPCEVRQVGRRRFHIILTQGLNRQIRRMCQALGYEVVRLRRRRIMHIELGRLPVGSWRELGPDELSRLFRDIEESRREVDGLPEGTEEFMESDEDWEQ
ncbi:MAG: pseudouridine synthase [Bacillota bacterium]|nr:pseudouridine synthase [Bacillota bacterium]